MNGAEKKKYTVSGKDAKYLKRALDRINVPYTRNSDSISLFLSDEEIAESKKMIRCEKEMEKIDYKFAVVTFKTSINYPLLDKILKSVGTKNGVVLDEDANDAER